MKVYADYFDAGNFVGICVKRDDGTSDCIRFPSAHLEDLIDTLNRMAYHGYIPHRTADTGSDYGRKAKDADSDDQ